MKNKISKIISTKNDVEVADYSEVDAINASLDNLPKEAFLNLKPLYDMRKEGTGRYRFDQKVEAIVNMRAHLDINDNSLELEPNFSPVSEYLGIPVGTLRSWWLRREEIIEVAAVLVDQLTQAAVIKNLTIQQRAQEELASRDFKETSTKDLVMLLKTLTVVNRINRDGNDPSTKTVKHEHRIKFVMPDS